MIKTTEYFLYYVDQQPMDFKISDRQAVRTPMNLQFTCTVCCCNPLGLYHIFFTHVRWTFWIFLIEFTRKIWFFEFLMLYSTSANQHNEIFLFQFWSYPVFYFLKCVLFPVLLNNFSYVSVFIFSFFQQNFIQLHHCMMGTV